MDNLSDFEHFYHSRAENNEDLPFDYVPNYPWWNAEADALWARRVRYSESLLTPNSLVSENRKVTFVTQVEEIQDLPARLYLIQARRDIEKASEKLGGGGYAWAEIESYLRGVRYAADELERKLKPLNAVFFRVIVRVIGDSE